MVASASSTAPRDFGRMVAGLWHQPGRRDSIAEGMAEACRGVRLDWELLDSGPLSPLGHFAPEFGSQAPSLPLYWEVFCVGDISSQGANGIISDSMSAPEKVLPSPMVRRRLEVVSDWPAVGGELTFKVMGQLIPVEFTRPAMISRDDRLLYSGVAELFCPQGASAILVEIVVKVDSQDVDRHFQLVELEGDATHPTDMLPVMCERTSRVVIDTWDSVGRGCTGICLNYDNRGIDTLDRPDIELSGAYECIFELPVDGNGRIKVPRIWGRYLSTWIPLNVGGEFEEKNLLRAGLSLGHFDWNAVELVFVPPAGLEVAEDAEVAYSIQDARWEGDSSLYSVMNTMELLKSNDRAAWVLEVPRLPYGEYRVSARLALANMKDGKVGFGLYKYTGLISDEGNQITLQLVDIVR